MLLGRLKYNQNYRIYLLNRPPLCTFSTEIFCTASTEGIYFKSHFHDSLFNLKNKVDRRLARILRITSIPNIMSLGWSYRAHILVLESQISFITMGRGKSKYKLHEKEAIVAEAFSMPNNIKATATKHAVQAKDIRYWQKRLTVAKNQFSPRKWKEKSRKFRSLCPGKRAKHSENDVVLAAYLENLRKQDRPVTVRLMCAEYKRLNAEDSHVPNSVIRRRIYRWMRRQHYTIRRITHKAQNTRHCADLIADWVQYVTGQIRMLGIPAENVANFDETNADFSIDSTTTLNKKGANTVSAKTAKSSQRASVMLGVSMAGERLTPYIIFKGSDKATGRVHREFTSRNHSYPPTMKYNVQGSAWMDEKCMLDWIERVWKPWAATKTGTTYLLLDEYAGHSTSKVLAALHACNTEVDFILKGYTAKLQVMDVGINRNFKDEYRRQFELFMVNSVDGKPHREDVSRWVWQAWESVTLESILNTWDKVFQRGNIEVAGELESFDDDDDEDPGVNLLLNDEESNDEDTIELSEFRQVAL